MSGLLLAALLLALQVVGPFDPSEPPWALDQRENAVQRLHRGPFEGRTTTWVRLSPKAGDPRVSPTTFVFVAEYAGRSPRTRPPVTWRIDTDLRFYPLLPRVPRLQVAIDGAPAIDLLAPGEGGSLGYCCDDTPIPTSATIALSAARFERLASAASVEGNALGVPFSLDRAQLRALAEFRKSLLP